MKKQLRGVVAVVAWLAAVFMAAPVSTASDLEPKIFRLPPAYSDTTDRVIVKFRDPELARAFVLDTARVQALGTTAGIGLRHVRPMSGDRQVFELSMRMPVTAIEAFARQLAADPAVEYAEPDRRMYPLQVPNDSLYASQLDLHDSGVQPAGINMPAAWDITTGDASIVTAVIDTGIVPHADIDTSVTDGVGRLVKGYDFISAYLGSYFVANDGSGRDLYPTDSGDWVTWQEAAYICGGYESDSSWHGTHVAGTIGALANNATGIAGINWTSRIQPIRVLGKCGGYLSDIADAIQWAAGAPVPGAPANATPAKVINLSLGAYTDSGCGITMQAAIDKAVARGAVVVVAAGNDGYSLVAWPVTPAICNNVITVAALNQAGGRASYSNYGTTVEIAAPGGGDTSDKCLNSTLNSGLTRPLASPGGDIYKRYCGTSMATPHVAGVASLMLSLRPAMTPTRTLAFLQGTARTFPTGTGRDCTTITCGAGVLDASAVLAAVNATVAPVVNAIASSDGTGAAPGTTVTMTGTATVTAPAAFLKHAWVQTVGPAVTLSYPTNTTDTLAASFTMPGISPGIPLSFRYTFTDDVGMSDSADVSVVVPNPVPTLASISPTVRAAGGPGFTLTVNGTKFVKGVSVVYWNGTPLTTTFVSTTQLTAKVLAVDVAAPGVVTVTVVSPGPGGGVTAGRTVTIEGPTITSLSSLAKPAGSAAFTLVVNGTSFVSGVSKVYWNGALRTTTFVSATQLKASIPATDVAAPGTAEVTVTNPPSGGTSAPVTFTIRAPAITTLSPASGPAGKAFTLTVNGSDFLSGVSKVYWNGALRTTTFVSATRLKASIPATDVAALGTADVTVMNGGGATSNTATFTIAAPAITSLSPLTKPAGSPAFALVINGTGFVSGISKVHWNGAEHTTTFVSATQLKASITAADLAAPGSAEVTVASLPAGGTSAPASFTIAAPTITTLNPATGPTGKAFTLVVNGTNFVSGVSKVYWNGALRTTTFVSTTQLKASILATDVPALGTADITVMNGASATSNTATFTISAPTVTSLSPLTKPAGSAAFTLIVNGSNFVTGVSKVYWNGAERVTTFVSPTQVKASILAADLATPGTAEVTVTNLPSGGTSAPASFTIAAPTITTLNPAAGPTGKAFTLVVNGTNFVSGISKVYWNGALRTTTFVSATQLKASILATDVPALGTADVTVMNGASVTSNTATFTITAPTITSLDPSFIKVFSDAFTLVVNGTNFVAGVSKVQWNGAERTTTFVSPTQLKAGIPADDLTT